MADDSFPTSRSSAFPAERPNASRNGQPGRILAGRYELLAEIGSGATAVTYQGRDQRLDRMVAIKVMRRDHELDPSFVRRFEREARTAASVSHGNVVDVYDVGHDNGDLYIVMQYVDGDDLKGLIARQGALPPSRASEIARQVLAGLGAIHAAGIIHRDIKPQNVLVGRDGIARVTDFGIAQIAMDVGLTTAGTTVGTAAYMAPEQAQGGQVTEATDLYAVGVMLFEMLTGEMPFEAPTPMALMLAHIQREPDPPSLRAVEGAIPPELDGIVLQAMAKDPADRFRSAAAMARALDGSSATSLRTTVLPSASARRTAVADAAQPAEWPRRPAPAGADRPVRMAPASAGRAGSGSRGALGALVLLLLLGLAGVAGYVAYGMVTDDDDQNAPAVAEGTSTATATATEEEATATRTPTAEPGATEEPEPTDVPIVAPTATSAPDPTATLVPTEVPTIPPTDVPTEVPQAEPTENDTGDDSEQMIQPVDGQGGTDNGEDDGESVPTQAGGDAQAPAAIDSSQIQPVGSGQSGSSSGSGSGSGQSGTSAGSGVSGGEAASDPPGSRDLGAEDWRGGGSRFDRDQGWVAVAPGESATVRFELDALPAAETFTIEIAMAVTGSGQVPLTVSVNGQELGSSDQALPILPDGGSVDELGSLRITLPTASLTDGRNEITITNGATDGSEDDGGGGNGNGNNATLADNTLLLAGATVSLDD